MSTENALSIAIPAEEITAVKEALKTVHEILKPYLVALTPEQRIELPKMNDKTRPFVSKALDYAESHQQFAPAYLDVAELKKDVDAVTQLTEMLRPIEQLNQNLNDSVMLAGSEAYVASLAYYNSVKLGARMNVTGTSSIYDDLRKRFAR